MYNRYSMNINEDEYSPVSAPDEFSERHEKAEPAGSLLHMLTKHEDGDSSLLSLGRSLFKNFNIRKIDIDDLLLFGIVYLLLREEGDNDLILIIAALYLFGIV